MRPLAERERIRVRACNQNEGSTGGGDREDKLVGGQGTEGPGEGVGPGGWSLNELEFRTLQEPPVVVAAFWPAAPGPAGR